MNRLLMATSLTVSRRSHNARVSVDVVYNLSAIICARVVWGQVSVGRRK